MEDPTAVNPGWRKSSYSTQSGASSCVEVGTVPWRKSSYSTQSGAGSCVEVGTTPWRKSSHSSQSGATSCVEVGTAPWRTSSYTGQSGAGTCLEAAHVPDAILVRDTTQHGHGPVLRLTPHDWHRLTTTLRTTTPH
jgi:hypothetical protein